jgi:hypothetical protein
MKNGINNEMILLKFLQREIIEDVKKPSGERYALEEITGEAFEAFHELCPELNYFELDDDEFKLNYINALRKKLGKKDFKHVYIDNPTDTGQFIQTTDGNRESPIEVPLDIEPDLKQANKLIDLFFNLPIFEKEAYKLRIRNNKLAEKINELKLQKKQILNDGSERKRKEINARINKLQNIILTNSHSKLSKIFSPSGIHALQRRASIRVYNQWNDLKKRLEEEVRNNNTY